jgi:hypothetical protein
MDKLNELELNKLPKDTAVVYKGQNTDYPMFVQALGRIERFIGGGESFSKDADITIELGKN